MKKYKKKTKNGQLEIRNKLAKGEELNQRELEILSRNYVRGLLRIQEASAKGFVFTCSDVVPLEAYLSRGLTREDFAFVIAQIVKIAQRINEFTLQQNNLELTLENVYMVNKSRELLFIYRPVISKLPSCDINSFLDSVIRAASFSAKQDTKYVEELQNVLKRMEKFPSEMVSDYVKWLDRDVFDLVLGSKGKRRDRRIDDDATGLLDDDATGLLGDDTDLLDYDNTTRILDDDDTGLLDDDLTGLLDEADGDATGLLSGDELFLQEDEGKQTEVKGVSLLFGENESGDLYGFYGRTFGDPVPEKQGADKTYISEDDKGTSIYEEDEKAWTSYSDSGGNNRAEEERNGGTTLHMEQQRQPWLERCSNGEKRTVDKPVFRIGKDKYHVDYFVDGNPAVSRNHAHIVSKYGRYFIVDNNSLNHSFVDGMIIPIQKEYEIFDGSAICLANENFIFHVNR